MSDNNFNWFDSEPSDSTEQPTRPSAPEDPRVRPEMQTLVGTRTKPISEELALPKVTNPLQAEAKPVIHKAETKNHNSEFEQILDERLLYLSESISLEEIQRVRDMILSTKFNNPNRETIDRAINAALFSINNPKDVIKTEPSKPKIQVKKKNFFSGLVAFLRGGK
jgi:hypothetical protein